MTFLSSTFPLCLPLMSGNIMSIGEPFAASYYDVKDGRIYSLRSQPEGIDVSEIAKAMGGGGHKHAAGFKITSF